VILGYLYLIYFVFFSKASDQITSYSTILVSFHAIVINFCWVFWEKITEKI